MSTTQAEAWQANLNPSGTIKTSVSIYFTLLGIGLFVFECVRRRYPHAYDSRGILANGFWTFETVNQANRLFGWITMLYKVSDDELLQRCGLDTLCFLRFLRLGQKMSLLVVALSVILFPLYATATPVLPESTSHSLDPLERINMSNLPPKSPRLWAPTVVTFLVCGYMMYLLWLEWVHYTKRRHEILSEMDVAQYSVMISDLPIRLRTWQTLERYLNQLFPKAIHEVHVAVECAKLEELVAERLSVQSALERVLARADITGRRPVQREGRSWFRMLCCRAGSMGQVVDAIEHYEQRLMKLNVKVAREVESIDNAQAELTKEVEKRERTSMSLLQGNQLDSQLEALVDTTSAGHSLRSNDNASDDADDAEDETDEAARTEADQEARDAARRKKPIRVMRSAAFVSFTSLQSVQLAKQAVYSGNPLRVMSAPAPHPDDVQWENVGLPYRKRAMWRLVSATLTALIVLFWTIPTAFVASLATVESLRHALPFLDKAFQEHAWLENIFKQLAPLVLVGLRALAPLVFNFLSAREGHASRTEVQAASFTKLAYFQLVQVFFVTVIIGTVFDSLKQVLDQPKLLIAMLGRSMPQQSTFFMSYVIVLTGLSLVLELLRAIPLLLSLLFSIFAPKLTQRERLGSWYGLCDICRTPVFDPTNILADCFLAMLVTLTFAPIAPLVCYFTGWFFFVAEIVYRRQVLFVYKASTYAMGAYWPPLFKFMIIALVLSQLTLLGLLSLKKGAQQFFCVGVLIVVIFLFNHYITDLYPRVAKVLPLTTCKELDEARYRMNPAKAFYFLEKAYRQPAMNEAPPLRADYRVISQPYDDYHDSRATR
ncbi:TPA: hypothetical protein N0F65_009017 [Lagenidium giganteum]|uniref:Uncharacterized protein n=1 Tax=Lagenidium giganteum TaxID=4803 RepID=A0AAV2YX16_9STRA|nr:TPA: hypothetical protein N0F65_009017 [Lagenidium giganteum]